MPLALEHAVRLTMLAECDRVVDMLDEGELELKREADDTRQGLRQRVGVALGLLDRAEELLEVGLKSGEVDCVSDLLEHCVEEPQSEGAGVPESEGVPERQELREPL